MRRYLLLSLLAAVVLFAQARRAIMVLSGPMSTGNGASSTALSSATTFAAFSIPGDGRTLNEVRFYTSAITGTVDGTELHAMLYSSSALHPASLVGSEDHTLAAGTITGAAWRTISGFSTTLTAGDHYWIVFKNTNATPASNYPTIRAISSTNSYWGGDYRAWGWMYRTATDNADPNLATWTTSTSIQSAMGIRLGFSNSTYAGLPASAQAGQYKSYGTTYVGMSFVAPANVTLYGVSSFVYKVGSPTGTLHYALYQDTTLVAATYTAAADETYSSGAWVPLYFASGQALTSGVRYRIVLVDSATDSSSNCYGIYGVSTDTDSNSLTLTGFGGTQQYATYNGSTWSDTQGTMLPVALFVDTFTSSGGTRAFVF